MFIGKKDVEKRKEDQLRKLEEERRKKLDSLMKDPYMGFDSLETAHKDCQMTSQAEVLGRLFRRENLFISGLAGSGKTTVINRFIEFIEAEYEGLFNIAVTASTGIAATLLKGRTIHSWAGLGISKEPFDPDNVDRMMWARLENLQTVDALIIDEISMLPAYLFTKLDAALKHFRRSKDPFGGVQIVAIGDFLQLPPVVGKNSEPDIDNRYTIESDAWKEADIQYCFLDKTYRATDPRLRRLLIEISRGSVSSESRTLINSRKNKTPLKDKVYTTLFTTNKNVDFHNQKEFDKNTNRTVIAHLRTGEGTQKDINEVIKRNALSRTLEFKVDTVVILTKNLQLPDGLLANGSLGIVTGFSDNRPIVKFNSGKVTVIDRAVYDIREKRSFVDIQTGKPKNYEVVVASVEQIPLKLGYAITVHKSQGQTFDGVITDLSRIFQPGLGYVALSRVRDLDDLVITGFSDKAYNVSEKSQKINTFVKKKAFINRKKFKDQKDDVESLLTDSFYRSMYWDVDKASGTRYNKI